MRTTRICCLGFLVGVVTSAASTLAMAAVLERGPYLQQATPNNITVRWRTDVATDAVVRFGVAPGSLDQVASGNQSGTDHEVMVTGLTPGTLYYYSIGDSTETLAGDGPTFTFRSSPATGTRESTRVWVIGDSGTADGNARDVRDGFIGFSGSRQADLWLMLGDNAYTSGTDEQYQAAVFDTYPTILRNTPLWPTLGNHDGLSADSNNEQGPYYDIFTLPRNAEAGGLASGTEAYYSFDYANIHFVVLDSYETDRSVGSAMLTWLENDLAATTQDWLVAFWHHPPYTKGSHNSDIEGRLIEMRERALPILESYGVDLVLSGHSHSYERSFLIDSHYGTSDTFSSSMLIDGGSGREDDTGVYQKMVPGSANEGAVYAVAGSSGKIGGGALDHPVMFFGLRALGSMVIDINGDRLDAVFVDDTGIQLDYFTIRKGLSSGDAEPPTEVSNLAAIDLKSTSLTLNWLAATDNVAVTGYRVERDGSVVANGDSLTFSDSGLSPNTTYMYSVAALDAAGNESTPTSVMVTTDSVPIVGRVGGSGAVSLAALLMLVGLVVVRACRFPVAVLSATALLILPLLAIAHEYIDAQLLTVGEKITESPYDYRLHAKRGELQALHGDWQPALASLRRAQALAPDAAASILDLRIGEVLHFSGDAKQALLFIDRHLSVHAESSLGWRIRAKIMANLNEIDAALASMERAIEYSAPLTPELFIERARILEHQVDRVGELLAGIDRGVRALGPLMALLEYAIDIELQRKNYVGALARMGALPEAIRQQPRWLYQQSLALKETGRSAEAEHFMRAALTAIGNLPPRRRSAPAYVALRSEIEGAL